MSKYIYPLLKKIRGDGDDRPVVYKFCSTETLLPQQAGVAPGRGQKSAASVAPPSMSPSMPAPPPTRVVSDFVYAVDWHRDI